MQGQVWWDFIWTLVPVMLILLPNTFTLCLMMLSLKIGVLCIALR